MMSNVFQDESKWSSTAKSYMQGHPPETGLLEELFVNFRAVGARCGRGEQTQTKRRSQKGCVELFLVQRKRFVENRENREHHHACVCLVSFPRDGNAGHRIRGLSDHRPG
ncbi:unnamed protein product, partial [Scytosiphon promiscuus]